MFLRVSRVTSGQRTYEYLQILETYREEGRHRQRVIANLGRLDRLGETLDNLMRSMRRYCREQFVSPTEIASRSSAVWGPILLARHLWEEMGLTEIIHRVCRSPRQKYDVAERAFVLVANRLTEPSSEHGLARWLEHTFVCDRQGRRWEPDWLPVEAITKDQRVKVSSGQLQRWYRTLDALLGAKEAIEGALYRRVRDLFSLQVNLVFYDVTSAYFQRREPTGRLRRHGKSRDGHPREVQVIVGVVMANGWPIAHHLFPGQTADKSTLQSVVADVQRRFGVRRVTVVADRGMVSEANLAFLSERGFRYLVGIKGRRSREAAQVLASLGEDEGAWVRVDEENRVQTVRLGEEPVRYFVVESGARKAYEQSLRERSMDRVGQALEKIARAVSAGRLKDPAKIGARAERAVAANHGKRYFSYAVGGEGQFTFEQDAEKMRAELAREGRYILKSDDPDLTAVDAVETYKELATVEAGFRDLKDVIAMRPIWHKTDDRIRAHILVATLALFLKRTLQHHLDAEGVCLSASDALGAMKTVSVTDLDLGGTKHRLVTSGGRDARRVLKALRLRDPRPPGCSQTERKR
jgi:transposase